MFRTGHQDPSRSLTFRHSLTIGRTVCVKKVFQFNVLSGNSKKRPRNASVTPNKTYAQVVALRYPRRRHVTSPPIRRFTHLANATRLTPERRRAQPVQTPGFNQKRNSPSGRVQARECWCSSNIRTGSLPRNSTQPPHTDAAYGMGSSIRKNNYRPK